MDEEEGPMQCRKRRGRPRACRSLGDVDFQCYGPMCDKGGRDTEPVFLLPSEMEAMRLVDLMDMDQETAARKVGVSRKTLWRDLHEARRKVTEALVNGKAIRITGCTRDADCPHENE